MVHITKKDHETSAALVRRFMQRVQASGILQEAKKKKFQAKKTSRNLRRRAALKRNERRLHYARLRKLGKVK